MSEFALAKLDRARLALSESRTLSEVLKIKDVAEAAKVYAKAAHLGRESQNYAAEIALLAARRAGELLGQLEKSKGGEPTKKKSTPATAAPVESAYSKALKETDTSERTAQYWQKLSRVPEDTAAKYVEDVTKAGGEISSSGLLKSQPHTEKRKNRSEPVDDFEQLRMLAVEMVDVGYKQLKENGENASHLHAAKTWAKGRLQK
jgi:hypothetical protein